MTLLLLEIFNVAASEQSENIRYCSAATVVWWTTTAGEAVEVVLYNLTVMAMQRGVIMWCDVDATLAVNRPSLFSLVTYRFTCLL